MSPPKTIASLFLTPRCDMSCAFCASAPDFSAMGFEQAAALLRELRARSFHNVVLGGGEPFLWSPGVVRLSELARALGFLVQVCTNGLTLPPGFETIPSIDRYILPLESMDPQRHDGLRRGREGHHEVVLERIERLAGSGRELTVSTVVTRENRNELGEIAAFLSRARARGVAIHAWHLYRFLPVGRGGAPNAGRLQIDRGEFVNACAEVKSLEHGFPVYRRDDMFRSSAVEFFWYQNGRLQIGGHTPDPIDPSV